MKSHQNKPSLRKTSYTMSTLNEEFSNDFIRLAALTELICNKFLITTLLSQQSQITEVLQKPLRDIQDMDVIYDCTNKINKIIDYKKQIIEKMKRKYMINSDSDSETENEIEDQTESDHESIEMQNESESNSKEIENDSNLIEMKIKFEPNLNEIEIENELESNVVEIKHQSKIESENELESNAVEIKHQSEIKNENENDSNEESFAENDENVKNLTSNGKRFVCTYDGCNRVYTTRQGLLHHIKKFHMNVKNYKCKQCNFEFYFKHRWEMHVLRTHSAGKTFACTYDGCDKVYKYRSGRFEHIQRFHLKIRNYECKECDAAFYNKWHLVTHSRMHTGETPFSCPVCNKRFSQKHGLKKHQRIHGHDQ